MASPLWHSPRRRQVCSSMIAFPALVSLHCLGADAGNARAAMVDIAREYLRAADWAPRKEFGVIPAAYYCNVFVADVCRRAGSATWDPIPGKLGNITPRDPLAREWEDPGFTIKGWKIIYHPKMQNAPSSASKIFAIREPGDVISGLGHMGIMSDDRSSSAPSVFSASAVTGAVELNNWSFRVPDPAKFSRALDFENAAFSAASRYTVRRFIGA
jgi:hypothetical protein